MIEIEKKFILTPEQRKRLITDAEFLKETVFTDVYYDTADYSLTCRDIWFRARDGKFELKLPLHSGPDRKADLYDELDEEEGIRKALNMPLEGSFAEALNVEGYAPFCECTTHRKKYRKEGFSIDLDTADFGDFTYEIAEIELMANDKSEMAATVEKILQFAKAHELTIASVPGKIRTFLKRKRPEHHKALVDAGVLRA